MGLFNALGFWSLYFTPSIIAWYRTKKGKPVFPSLGRIFFFNLLLAWTVVGWLLVLANALGYNPVAWFVLRYGKFLVGGSGQTAPPSEAGLPAGGSSAGETCSQCGGSGSLMCSTCGGRGSWYTQPTTATDIAQLQSCGACISSGRIRCTYCGGSGRRTF